MHAFLSSPKARCLKPLPSKGLSVKTEICFSLSYDKFYTTVLKQLTITLVFGQIYITFRYRTAVLLKIVILCSCWLDQALYWNKYTLRTCIVHDIVVPNVCSLKLALVLTITMTSQWARWRLKSPALRLFRHSSKKASKLHVTGLCEGNSPVTGEFIAQRISDAENVSVWWRHHDSKPLLLCSFSNYIIIVAGVMTTDSPKPVCHHVPQHRTSIISPQLRSRWWSSCNSLTRRLTPEQSDAYIEGELNRHHGDNESFKWILLTLLIFTCFHLLIPKLVLLIKRFCRNI